MFNHTLGKNVLAIIVGIASVSIGAIGFVVSQSQGNSVDSSAMRPADTSDTRSVVSGVLNSNQLTVDVLNAQSKLIKESETGQVSNYRNIKNGYDDTAKEVGEDWDDD